MGTSLVRQRNWLGFEFPFNWDPQRVGTEKGRISGMEGPSSFHSIGIPSEWGLHGSVATGLAIGRFHSIGIPSEWGHYEHEGYDLGELGWVSIQLGSPASGDYCRHSLFCR